jgi:hypothetical protein
MWSLANRPCGFYFHPQGWPKGPKSLKSENALKKRYALTARARTLGSFRKIAKGGARHPMCLHFHRQNIRSAKNAFSSPPFGFVA